MARAPNSRTTTLRPRIPGDAPPHLGDSYWHLTQRPLQSLVFLLPLIFAYEMGVLVYATDHARGVSEHIVARSLVRDFMDWLGLGVPGLYLPGAVMVLSLLAWHVARGDPWRVEARMMGYMAAEALALALPLFVFAMVLLRFQAAPPQASVPTPAAPTLQVTATQGAHPASPPQAPVSPPATDLSPPPIATDPGWQAGLVFSIGAGLYEELLFRLLGIHFFAALCVQVLALPRPVSLNLAVLAAATLFGLYHFKSLSELRLGAFLFYAGAGLYLGYVFVLRGFGIAVAAHALYDVMVVALRFQDA